MSTNSIGGAFYIAGSEARAEVDTAGVVRSISQRKPYAVMMTVGSESDGREYAVAVKAASLAEYNSDASSGTLYAVYTAEIDDGDADEGTALSWAALGPDEGESVVRVRFDPVIKRAGCGITVRAEIRPEFGGEILPCGGKNLFVEALLGFGMAGELTLASGSNFHPNEVINRTQAAIRERPETTVAFEGGTISARAEFTGAVYPTHEFLLLMDGKPVMRTMHIGGVHSRSITEALGVNLAVEIPSVICLSAAYVQSGGRSVSYYTYPYSTYASLGAPDLVPYTLPQSARLIGEPSYNYFAVRDGREITVFDVENGKANALYKLSLTSGNAELLGDGSLLVTDGDARIERFRGGRTTAIPLTLASDASDAHGVLDGEGYFVAARRGSEVLFLRVSGEGEVTVSERIAEVSDRFGFTRRNRCLIDVHDPGAGIYRSIGPGGENAKNAETLRRYYGDAAVYVDKQLGKWLVYTKNESERYCVDLESEYSMRLRARDEYLDLGDRVYGIAYGSYGRIVESDMAGKLHTITGENVLPVAKEVVMVGDYMLAHTADGKVVTYYFIPYGMIVRCPYLSGGEQISLRTVEADDPAAGGSGVNAEMKITLSSPAVS